MWLRRSLIANSCDGGIPNGSWGFTRDDADLASQRSQRCTHPCNAKFGALPAVGDVHGDIKLITVAWAEGIQAAIHAFKEITSPYWLSEKRLHDNKIALMGDKITEAARAKRRSST